MASWTGVFARDRVCADAARQYAAEYHGGRGTSHRRVGGDAAARTSAAVGAGDCPHRAAGIAVNGKVVSL